MNIDNITSDGIALTNNGKEMLIKVYEQEIKRLKEEYMILQNASDEVEEEKDKEIERLQDLCNKYEKEHKTAFEEWKKAINIIKEVREYINSLGWNTTIPNIQDNVWGILDKVGDEK